MIVPRDPVTAIITGLAPILGQADDIVACSTPWFSATFAGARHRIDLTVARSPEAARIVETIGTIEFTVRGRLVADIAVVAIEEFDDRLRLSIEALVIDEA